MLLKIGKNKQSAELGDRLVECHQRIRNFVGVARRLAASPDAPAAEIKEAAMGVRRYFSESLPRHTADEDESIKPRLAGRDAAVDASLARMSAEHLEHDARVKQLVEMCRALEAAPERVREVGAELAENSAELERQFQSHLEEEERVIVPALQRLLSAEEREAIIAEMAKRR